MKNETAIEFLVKPSKAEGCQVVLRRTMADFQRLPLLASEKEQPLTLRASTSAGQTTFAFHPAQSTLPVGLVSFDFLTQSSYSENWARELERKLLVTGEGARFALDPSCGSSEAPYSTFAAVNGDFPRWSSDTSDRLPLKSAGAIPDLQFTYATAETSQSLTLALGLDTGKLLEAVQAKETSDIVKVEWMLGRKVDYGSWPLSDWATIEVPSFLAPRFTLDVGAMAPRALTRFYRTIVAFRITLKDLSPQEIFFVPVADYCAPAYSRSDSAAYHAALFRDATNSAWNDAPNREKKTGCAFVGVEEEGR